MSFIIRNFFLSDLDSVLKIEKDSFKNSAFSELVFIQYYHDGTKKFIISELDGEVAGYAIGHVSKELGRIVSIAVQHNQRNKGVGKSLMAYFERKFLSQKVKRLELEVNINNNEAVDFYKYLGFSISGLIKRYYEDGSNAYVMSKHLGRTDKRI